MLQFQEKMNLQVYASGLQRMREGSKFRAFLNWRSFSLRGSIESVIQRWICYNQFQQPLDDQVTPWQAAESKHMGVSYDPQQLR